MVFNHELPLGRDVYFGRGFRNRCRSMLPECDGDLVTSSSLPVTLVGGRLSISRATGSSSASPRRQICVSQDTLAGPLPSSYGRPVRCQRVVNSDRHHSAPAGSGSSVRLAGPGCNGSARFDGQHLLFVIFGVKRYSLCLSSSPSGLVLEESDDRKLI